MASSSAIIPIRPTKSLAYSPLCLNDMEKSSKIYVAGHTGLVGSGIVRKLQSEGFANLVLKTRKELDLLDTERVHEFFKNEHPEYVIDAAARVGGIKAN